MIINKKNIIKIIICFLQINFNLAFCGTLHHKIPNHQYVEYGKKYDCVVEILGISNEDHKKQRLVYGSAVLIDKKWAITAAHVVNSISDVKIKFKNKYYLVKKIIKNKKFKYGNFSSGGDIALCILNEEINLKNFPSLYKDKDELAQQCSISGFGLYGNALTSKRECDHIRRAGTNKVISTSKNYLECDMSLNFPTSLEFAPSIGDSGGGLFIKGKLAGINSFITGKMNCLYGDSSFHTRISTYVDWIEKTMNDHDKTS